MRPAESYIPCESCGATRPGASAPSAFGAGAAPGSPSQFGGSSSFGQAPQFGSGGSFGDAPYGAPSPSSSGSSTKTVLLVVAGLSLCGLFSCCGLVGFGAYQGYREAEAQRSGLTTNAAMPQVESSDRLIVVPSYGGLVATSALHADAQLQMQNPLSEFYLLGFSEPKSGFDPGFSLEQYGTVITQAMAVEAKILSQPVAVSVGSRSGQRYRIQGMLNGTPIVYWLVVAESEQHFHQLLFWTSGANESQHEPTMQRIVTEATVRSTF